MRSCPERLAVRRILRGALVVIGFLLLGGLLGCTSPEEQRAEHLRAGEGFLGESNFAKARVEFANALAINANDVEARLGAGRAAEGLEDFRAAYGHYQAAVDANPREVRGLVALGRLLFFGGALEDARKRIDAALAIEPRHAEALAVRGALALAASDVASAQRDVDAALALAPDDTYALSLAASLRVRAGDIAGALALLESATSRKPNDLPLRRLFAELLLRQQRPREAIAQLREIVRLQPLVLAHRLQVVDLHMRLGDPASAEQALREAVTALPKDDDVKLALIDFLRLAGRPADALATLKGYVAAADGNFAMQVALGRLHGLMGDRIEARRVLTDFVEQAGEGVQAARGRVELARVELADGKLDAASDLVEKVLAENALDAGGLSVRAAIALRKRDFATAIADLRSALRDAPDDVEMLRQLAIAYLGSGDRALARQTLQAVVERAKSDIDSRVSLAELYLVDGQHDAIESLLDGAGPVQQRDGRIEQMRARLALARRDWTSAAASASRLVMMPNFTAVGHFMSGLAAEGRGDLRSAETAWRASLAVQPTGAEPLTRLVTLLSKARRTDDARAVLQAALAKAPGHALALQMLGEIELSAGDRVAARQRFEAAASARPSWWVPYRALAILAREQNDLVAARAAYRRGIAASTEARLLLDLAAFELSAGDRRAAATAYRQAIERDPESLEAANNLAMLLVDDAAASKAQLDEAQALARKLTRSSVPAHLDTLGWVHFRRGEHALAVQYLERAVANSPKDPGMRYRLAAGQAALLRLADARENLGSALRSADFPERIEAERLQQRIGEG